MKRKTLMAVVAAAAVSITALGPGAGAAPEPTATPPTPQELRQASAAMLQPGMVPAVLGGPGPQQIGYNTPTGGQDPYPVCQPPNADPVIPSLDMTTGFFSNINQDADASVSQQAIVYPSVDGAQANWALLAEQIQQQCSFSGKGENAGVVITNGGAPGADALWTSYQRGPRNPSSEYTVIGLSGDAIVSLRFSDLVSADITADQRTAVETVWAQLSDRFADRTTPTGVQSTTLSIAETAMLNPADVGSDIPIGTPDQGAWSSFSASLPGTAPLDPCEARLDFFPGGNASFSANFGGDGGVFVNNGLIMQRAFTYDDAAAADAAWQQITTKLPDCNQRDGQLFDKKESAARQVARESAVTVDGTPGWFVRELTTNGNSDKQFRFTTRSYQLLLKSGNVISWVTYAKSEMGLRPFFIDEPPINELAVQLIDRFTNTVVTTL
ncbi:MAG TPA: hypothetical protein VGP37_10970 [Candidatus Nanopelagicales bacterium]|nr:hypothetical protein [Candidatus Nanopelagicales bacterium]